MSRFNRELQLTLQAAMREAVLRRHAYLTVEHLLLALCHDERGAEVLRHSGVNLKRLKTRLAALPRRRDRGRARRGADRDRPDARVPPRRPAGARARRQRGARRGRGRRSGRGDLPGARLAGRLAAAHAGRLAARRAEVHLARRLEAAGLALGRAVERLGARARPAGRRRRRGHSPIRSRPSRPTSPSARARASSTRWSAARPRSTA